MTDLLLWLDNDMKQLLATLSAALTLSAIAQDGVLQNVSGTTALGATISTIQLWKTNAVDGSVTNANGGGFSVGLNGSPVSIGGTAHSITATGGGTIIMSNNVAHDAASTLSVSNLTPSKVVTVSAGNVLVSSTLGAVPINGDTTATTAAQINALAWPGVLVTNNESLAIVHSNTLAIDAAHALSVSNLTASRVVLTSAADALSSATASGAVPIDADGSATTAAQFNALFPGNILTNGYSASSTLSNSLAIYYAVGPTLEFLLDANGLSMFNAGTLNYRVNTAGKVSNYQTVATSGYGIPVIYKASRVTAQSAANASITTFTVGVSDGSFEVSMNMNVSASTSVSTSMNCTYTDESNTSRTMIFPTTSLSGSFVAGGLVTATGAFETPVMHIRCKASTTITLFTAAGTFTGVTYTAEGIIKETQ